MRLIYSLQQPPESTMMYVLNTILGDFNYVCLDKTPTNFYQYVLCTIKWDKIFNIHKSFPLQPLKYALVASFPKSSRILSDFRPVALTLIVMIILEKVVWSNILQSAEHVPDPLQFAYRTPIGVYYRIPHSFVLVCSLGVIIHFYLLFFLLLLR